MFLSRILLLFFVLKCLVISCSSYTKSAPPKYQMFCDVSYRVPAMSTLPKYCSALASSNDTTESINNISPLKHENTIFMRLIAGRTYEQWQTDLINEATVDAYTVAIVHQRINYICFDNLYSEQKHSAVDMGTTAKIIGFLDSLKSKNPLVKVGIALPKYGQYLKNAFDLASLDDYVDFYLLKANNYRKCGHHYFHKDFRRTQDKDLDDSIQALRDEKYSLKKVLLLMDINAYSHTSMTWHPSRRYSTISYTDLCTQKHSMFRTMCLDTLQQFYNKATEVRKNNMMGLYVQYIISDDLEGNCQCMDASGTDTYPILNVLSKALSGVDGGGLLTCKMWAQPPQK